MANRNFILPETLSEKAFVCEARKHNPLSVDETASLALKAQDGDMQAKDLLYKANMRLIITSAKSYQGCGVHLEDLLQEGTIGLWEAIDTFDPTRAQFSTYAGLLIKAHILHSLQKEGRLVRIPKGKADLQRKIRRVSDEYSAKYGVQPSVDTIAEMLGKSEREVRKALATDYSYVEGDDVVGTDKDGKVKTRFDLLALAAEESETDLDLEDSCQEMHIMLSALSDRERKVFVMRHGLEGDDMTLLDIADTLGISAEGVRQIDQRAQKKLLTRVRELGFCA